MLDVISYCSAPCASSTQRRRALTCFASSSRRPRRALHKGSMGSALGLRRRASFVAGRARSLAFSAIGIVWRWRQRGRRGPWTCRRTRRSCPAAPAPHASPTKLGSIEWAERAARVRCDPRPFARSRRIFITYDALGHRSRLSTSSATARSRRAAGRPGRARRRGPRTLSEWRGVGTSAASHGAAVDRWAPRAPRRWRSPWPARSRRA